MVTQGSNISVYRLSSNLEFFTEVLPRLPSRFGVLRACSTRQFNLLLFYSCSMYVFLSLLAINHGLF